MCGKICDRKEIDGDDDDGRVNSIVDFTISFALARFPATLTIPRDSFLLRCSSRSIWLRCSIINVRSYT